MARQKSASEGHGGHDDSRQSDPGLGSSLGGSELFPAGEKDERIFKSNERR